MILKPTVVQKYIHIYIPSKDVRWKSEKYKHMAQFKFSKNYLANISTIASFQTNASHHGYICAVFLKPNFLLHLFSCL